MVIPEPSVFPRVDDHLVHLEARDELVCGHMVLDCGTDACIRCEDIDPVPELTAVEAKAREAGLAQGLAKGIVAVCDVLEIPLDADRLSYIETLDVATLEALLTTISAERRWP